MLQSLITTTTNPLLRSLFPPPTPLPPPHLQIPIPETKKQPLLDLNLERRERNILRAKDKTFNVEVLVDEEDDMEECLNRFNREVARTGLLRECRRRRFYENAREKRKRKRQEAAFLRRRARLHRQKDSFKQNETSPIENGDMRDDLWASDESFEALINDEEVSDEEIESRFQDDGEGTWQLFDEISHT